MRLYIKKSLSDFYRTFKPWHVEVVSCNIQTNNFKQRKKKPSYECKQNCGFIYLNNLWMCSLSLSVFQFIVSWKKNSGNRNPYSALLTSTLYGDIFEHNVAQLKQPHLLVEFILFKCSYI